MLLLRRLQLRSILMEPLHAQRPETRTRHASIYHGHQLGRHAALERFTQHGLFDPSLLQTERLLPCLLFLLLPLVLLRLRGQPMPHRFLLAMPLLRRLWNDTQ